MKKLIALLTVLMLISLTACAGNGSSAPTETNTQTPSDNGGGETGADQEGQPSGRPGMADGGFNFDNIVYGEVYEIIGNFVTLKLIETPATGMTMTGNFDGAGMAADFEGLSEEEIAAMLQEMRDSMGDGAGAFRMDGAESSDGSGTVLSPSGGAVQRETQYTGEEIDVIIPVGVPVVTTLRGESGTEESEIKLETVKAGDTLMITYDEDGETITKITLVPAGSGMGMRIGGGQAPSGGDIMQFTAP